MFATIMYGMIFGFKDLFEVLAGFEGLFDMSFYSEGLCGMTRRRFGIRIVGL